MDQDTMRDVPPAIQLEVVRQQDKMGWPDYVPRYAEVPHRGGKMLFKRFDDLTVGDCEQLVEYHVRHARAAIARWYCTESRSSCQTAAHHILYARLYRCSYITLIGQTNSTEADLPFSCE